MALSPKEQLEQDLANARDRVSFLLWALDAHRASIDTHGSCWRQKLKELNRSLELATLELHRLEGDQQDSTKG
jgi:hypothetical protein